MRRASSTPSSIVTQSAGRLKTDERLDEWAAAASSLRSVHSPTSAMGGSELPMQPGDAPGQEWRRRVGSPSCRPVVERQFRLPHASDVLERRPTVHGVREDENLRVGVHKRPDSVVLRLTGGIPRAQRDWAPVDQYGRHAGISYNSSLSSLVMPL